MLVTCYVSSRRYLLVNCSDRNETGKLKKPKLSKKKKKQRSAMRIFPPRLLTAVVFYYHYYKQRKTEGEVV